MVVLIFAGKASGSRPSLLPIPAFNESRHMSSLLDMSMKSTDPSGVV
jgi:hypothetical protein